MQALPDYRTRITMDLTICHGQPVVRGLRYPVALVFELLAAGMTEAEILADYPDLEPADFGACYAYAAERLKPRVPSNLSMNGLTPEEWDAKRISGPMSPAQFKAYLQRIGKLPPDAEPAREESL